MDPARVSELEAELEAELARCRELLAAHQLEETEPGLWTLRREGPVPPVVPFLLVGAVVVSLVIGLAEHFGERAERRRSGLIQR